ncbi:Kelch repeat protein [Penicillium digitatum PHI26]|uniref:Kelch repeat protein n=3 Tax=Penicillium digitatum TaxID=36651 RepID=K9GFR3_PEND2|nr:Kelch repeat protein [Penicillium digitatum Pd1]EKV05113.1 Kelch repeat protein [Penicillium digitatum Pd1]EKV13628.1 Kelch repeat protein [Penicillium digitatum PHI26]
MAPIEENGAIWEFDPSANKWSFLRPSEPVTTAFPAARSYHCTANDGKDTVFVHAGCPEKGRLSDLWAFSVSQKKWAELAAAPDPPRGGTSIAFTGGRLYRMNGFDGEREQGGRVDIYEPGTNLWGSHSFIPDGVTGPSPRSVATLLPIVVSGRVYLVTLLGEQDPSSLGHQGAGKMLGDVWVFDVEAKLWTKVEPQGDECPAPRGWYDGDVLEDSSVVVHGGLGESNNRLGDVWTLEFF